MIEGKKWGPASITTKVRVPKGEEWIFHLIDPATGEYERDVERAMTRQRWALMYCEAVPVVWGLAHGYYGA